MGRVGGEMSWRLPVPASRANPRRLIVRQSPRRGSCRDAIVPSLNSESSSSQGCRSFRAGAKTEKLLEGFIDK
ncbi:hypothetical protein BaRGS_00003813 [Batillaria attramentaria]|uniref:Uncharacterized protein n=1 Tax=Batillaria attramentaria TaxID=370345 RepID=A0ABD0LYU2_9CAEN